MAPRLRVGVLFGGRSGEHQVSVSLRRIGHGRSRSREIRGRANRHHDRGPMVAWRLPRGLFESGAPQVRALPAPGGTEDRTRAHCVPPRRTAGCSRTCGKGWTSSSRSCTVHSAKTGQYRVCLRWPISPTSGRRCTGLGGRYGQRAHEGRSSPGGLPVPDYLVFPAARNGKPLP